MHIACGLRTIIVTINHFIVRLKQGGQPQKCQTQKYDQKMERKE